MSLDAKCIAHLNELVGEALSEGRAAVEAQSIGDQFLLQELPLLRLLPS